MTTSFHSPATRIAAAGLSCVLLVIATVGSVGAVERRHAIRATAETNINRPSAHRASDAGDRRHLQASRNVNRSREVRRDVNVNVDVDRHERNRWNDWDDDYHPVATAAAVTATVALTSAVIGSIVNAPPSNCVPVNVNGIAYQQCGSTWYQPQYFGTNIQYVVVNPPR
ncbi:hypothetical protein CR920_08455 [Stenotrophomonas indicatrix]|nr:hypothetical protein CR920_08455 [Stenotrophomonas indicatrix]